LDAAARRDAAMTRIPISLELLDRICKAFLDMTAQGAVCPDATLMEALDEELARADRRRPEDRH
jgi:hypothetical protein